MAQMTLKLSDGQCWIYPAKSYTGYDYVKKTKNHWYKGHSILSNRGKYCHQGGTSVDSGDHNGNMLSLLLFKDGSGRTLRQAVAAMGGSGKITKVTLQVYCSHGWSGSFNARWCFTPYWDTKNWGSGGLTACPHDSYDGLGFKYVTTTTLKKGSWHNIDLTPWKWHLDTQESIGMYHPGAYNKSNSSYGRIDAQDLSTAAKLVIEYNTNSAPNAPSVTVHTGKDGHGWYLPNMDFTIGSNGDPDNNIHGSTPYAYTLYNQNGNVIKESGWTGTARHSYNLDGYRGQTVKIRGHIRDSEGLTAYRDVNVYINSRPYWNGISSEQVKINFIAGVTNGVFQNNVTMNWPGATDPQSAHASNLRYSIYAQKGTDKGPSGDTDAICVASGLTGTSHTLNAAAMSKVPVSRGERVYFSVWVSDGLEWSSYRLTSSWIYRDQPPSAPTNVSPTSGHYESSVNVSWSASQGSNGSSIKHYVVNLLNSSGSVVKGYTSTTTSMTCSDLGLISRGADFKFQVYSVDNLDNTSSSAYSGTLRRNSAPTKPASFKVNADTLYFINSIPLIWTASRDNDGDTIKYNVYYSANNGGYQELVRGTTSTTANHDISGFNPGTKFNYYVEAYDTFNVFSEKAYISAQPQVNTPPETPDLLLPYSDRVLYTNVPRVTFKTKAIKNDRSLTIYITVNGKTYNSKNDSTLFSKVSYGGTEEGMFMIPNDAPLNYSKNNNISIKAYDTMNYSESKSLTLSVDSTTVKKIGPTEDRFIQAQEIINMRAMINANRFAYGLRQIDWAEQLTTGSNIGKRHFEQLADNIHTLTTDLNNKAKCDHLKRNYIKDTLSVGAIINKNVQNNILEMILKS